LLNVQKTRFITFATYNQNTLYLMKFFSIITFVLYSFSLFSQTSIKNKAYYENEIARFSKMKSTGAALLVLGGAATVGGILLVSSASWETQTTEDGQTNATTQDASGGLGMLLLVGSLPLTIGGGIFTSIGSSKERQNKRLLNSLSFSPIIERKKTGMSIAYRF